MTRSVLRLGEELRQRLREESGPSYVAPMLATLTDDRFSHPAWIFERKLDGVRAIGMRDGDEVRLLSRNRKRMDSSYPELVEALGAVALDFRDPLRFTQHRNREGEAYYRLACSSGWEGVLAKRADSSYASGRTRDWLKFKCVATQEFVIGGFTDPQGSRLGFGALLVGYHEDGTLRYAGKVGTGYDERTLRTLRDRLDDLEQGHPAFDEDVRERGAHWVEPRLVCEVAFTEWTDDGKLRHPRYLGLRDDKDASEVVRETPEPS